MVERSMRGFADGIRVGGVEYGEAEEPGSFDCDILTLQGSGWHVGRPDLSFTMHCMMQTSNLINIGIMSLFDDLRLIG